MGDAGGLHPLPDVAAMGGEGHLDRARMGGSRPLPDGTAAPELPRSRARGNGRCLAIRGGDGRETGRATPGRG